MAIEWYERTSYVNIGLDWQRSDSGGSVSVTPIVYRWDNQDTNNYGSKFYERLSPDPSGAGAWDGLGWGSGYGTRSVDTFATRTYNKTHSAQTVRMEIGWDSSFGSFSGSFINLGSGSHTWTITIPALDQHTVYYNANGGSGAPGSQTKWYGSILTLSSTRPTRAGYEFLGWATSANGGVSYNPGGQYGADSNITLYAVWRINEWGVSYSANGGSGAPGNQTKIYGTTLTLSSVKPTRTGYTFKNWNTAANGGGTAYASGGAYTANATLVLYAQWTKISYVVSFDANGGTGAPANQAKWYDETLKISDIVPVRDKYNFLGWATSASGAVVYQPGAAYTTNAALALYAKWKLKYIPPTFISLAAVRSTSIGVASNDGTYIHVTGSWKVDTVVNSDNKATKLKIEYKTTDSATWVSASDTNPNVATGKVNLTIGSNGILLGKAYDVRATIYDSGGNDSKQTIVSPQFRIFDVGNEGKTIAFGAPAGDEEGFECNIPAKFNNNIFVGVNGVYNQMGDFVVTQGISNGWSYVKWNSGRAECYKCLTIADLTPSTVSAGLYYCTSGSIALPITFKSMPVVEITANLGDRTLGASAKTVTTSSFNMHIWSTSNAAFGSPIFHLHVSGRWL